MTFNSKDFGRRIHDLRRAEGLTQDKLAEDINVSQEYISKLETGSRACSLDILTSLCARFHVSADYLLWGSMGNKDYMQGEIRSLGEGLLELSERL